MIHFVYVLLVILSLYLGFVLSSISYIFANTDFFKINIVQLFSPVIQIVFAILIALFINVKLPKKTKKNEILILMLDDLNNIIIEINKNIYAYYSDKENSENQNIILNNFKQASQKLTSIKNIARMLKLDITQLNSLPEKLRSYKQEVTNDPFGQQADYTISRKQKIDLCDSLIKEEINLIKINIYDY